MMEKRKFTPLDKWVYLKINTGIKTSDVILEEVIQPAIEYFKIKNYISKWYFIRYNDSKSQLRVRFSTENIQNHFLVLNKMTEELQRFVNSAEISNFSIETYNRQIERYGENTIFYAETLFHKNSELTLLFIQYNDTDKILFSLFYIDTLLNKLGFEIQEKLNWIKDFNISYKEEFNADKKLNSQLDKKYRQFKPKLKNFFDLDKSMDEKNRIISNIEECALELQIILQYHQKKSLKISLQSFFQSIFHMSINRLFVSNQRLFEMVIYDYLFRYYKSIRFYEVHRNKQDITIVN